MSRKEIDDYSDKKLRELRDHEEKVRKGLSELYFKEKKERSG